MPLAFKFTKIAAEMDCKEAIFKMGYYYQHGIEIEKNINFAIKKYDEAAAQVHKFYIFDHVYRVMN